MDDGVHAPVLLDEVITAPAVAGRQYVDATFGRGGHSREILTRLGSGRLVALDRDPDAERSAQAIVRSALHVPAMLVLRASPMRWRPFGVVASTGFLFDLGISSPQIDDPTRLLVSRRRSSRHG
jgi:16S rRNA (cytosine1402-N4)-methyltransferase